MANLRTAMDAAFWDLNVASPQNLDGSARSVPRQPFPLDGARASRALRAPQISLLSTGFPLGILPCFSPPIFNKNNKNDLGSFSLQSLLFQQEFTDGWLALVGQFRPKKLISSIKAEFSSGDDWALPAFKDVAKHFVDKSLFWLGFSSQFSPTPSFSAMFNVEKYGERKGYRTKAVLFHKLPFHDVTLEAAWPELFIDHRGKYWELPSSVSLDLSSFVLESGLRYRLGIHKNTGDALAVNGPSGEVPSALMPGICTKAAFSYEKSRDFWRKKLRPEDLIVNTDKGASFLTSYDMCLREPHAAISGIIGGTCAAWFQTNKSTNNGETTSMAAKSSLDADLFGSVCCTFQHGQFRKSFGDLTRLDLRLDVCSVLGLAKRVSGIFSNSIVREGNTLSSPRLNLIFQQQVTGPIVFRLDSRFSIDSLSGQRRPHIEDCICSFSYALKLLRSGKVVAWYSPKRKEGMVELRLFEF